MDVRKIRRNIRLGYVSATAFFLLLMACSVVLFILGIRYETKQLIQTQLMDNVTRQVESYELMLNVQRLELDEAQDEADAEQDLATPRRTAFYKIYDGKGYSVILSRDGTVLSGNGAGWTCRLREGEDYFAHCRDWLYMGGASAQSLIEAIAQGQTGSVRFRHEQDSTENVLVYMPVGTEGWMLCYVVPEYVLEQPYLFLMRGEILLALVMLVCMWALICVIWRMSDSYQDELIDFAQTDALTTVRNKQRTQEEIDAWMQDERCEGTQVFLMLDIDYFKEINDRYGHATGDEALRQVSVTLRREFRPEDIIGRIGGDEFVVLMKNVTTRQAALSRATMLCRRMREIDVQGIGAGKIHCSVGIAYAPQDGESYHELYLSADRALYQAKLDGRDRFCESRIA